MIYFVNYLNNLNFILESSERKQNKKNIQLYLLSRRIMSISPRNLMIFLFFLDSKKCEVNAGNPFTGRIVQKDIGNKIFKLLIKYQLDN